jgi:hypothetical protein
VVDRATSTCRKDEFGIFEHQPGVAECDSDSCVPDARVCSDGALGNEGAPKKFLVNNSRAKFKKPNTSTATTHKINANEMSKRIARPRNQSCPKQPVHAATDSTGRGGGGGGARFNAASVLAAYSHNSIAMMLPPGSDSTSGSKLPPMLWMRAAMRPALDSIKFIMSVSYTADLRSCLNNICLGNYLL